MKKLFSLFAAVITAMAMNATDIVFNFTNTDSITAYGWSVPATSKAFSLDGKSLTRGGVTIAFAKSTGQTDIRLYTGTNGTTNLRTYAGNALTISVSGEDKINEIIFDAAMTISGGTESKADHIFAGGVQSAVFNSKATLSTITVKINEEVVVWTPDTIGVTEARALIANSAPNMSKTHYIKGVVKDSAFTAAGKYAFWISDINNNADTLEVFDCKKDTNNTAWTSLDELNATIIKGDTVLVFASALKAYSATVYETTSACYVKTLGYTERPETTDLNLNRAYTEIEGTTVFLYMIGNNDSIYFSFPMGEKSIAGKYNAQGESVFFYHNSIETGVSQGTITLEYASQSSTTDYVYNVSVSLTDANNTTYTGSVVLKANGNFENDNTNIDCAVAADIVSKLADKTSTDITYKVYGYYIKFAGKYAWDTEYKTQTFWMNDAASASRGTFEVYQGTIGTTAADTCVKGDFVCVTSKLYRYGTTYETTKPTTIEKMDPKDAPFIRHLNIDTIDVTAAEAYQIGLTMEDTLSAGLYRMKTYVAKIKTAYSAQYGNISFYVNDTVGETYGDLQIFRAKPLVLKDSTLQAGDGVEIVGKISRYVASYTSIEIVNGYYTILSHTPVEEATENKKATKFLRKGEIVIRRGEALYNLAGEKLK